MDRSWISRSKPGNREYEVGIREFIKFAVNNSGGLERLPCPCFKCHNVSHKRVDEILNHLSKWAFDKTYTCWWRHGEQRNRPSMSASTNDNNIIEDHNGEGDKLEDMMRNVEDKLNDNPEAFERLLSDSEKPLYEGCEEYTRLSSVLKLYNLKAAHSWSDTSFSKLLGLVKDMLPKDNVLPSSTYEAKKIMSTMGLPYKKIHACPNDCILYQNEWESLTSCPICNASRYKKKEGVPAKVVWYFPIIPRFQRLFSKAEDAKKLIWHSEGRKKDGKLRHPADSPQWRFIDTEFGDFGREDRNLRLALSTDGMNPYGSLNSTHSTWPVILVTYNLPPSLCMKREYMMLSFLISGPKQPGNDICVYLAPLVDAFLVFQAKDTFVQWPTHLIFPKKKSLKAGLSNKSSRSPSSQGSSSKQYVFTEKDLAKVTSGLLEALKNEAFGMKKSGKTIKLTIPYSVFQNENDVTLDYEDMLNWCFQREVGFDQMSIFMRELSEKCTKHGILGVFGFIDPNYISPLTPTKEEERSDYLSQAFACNGAMNRHQLFFAPYHEVEHCMLAAISPWNGIVFWLDPAGEENDVRPFAKRIINEGIKKFSLIHRTDVKKIKKGDAGIKWFKRQCPRQAQDIEDYGYYVCRYMHETIDNRRPLIPEKYFNDTPTYSQKEIDEVRDTWVTYVLKNKEVDK